MATERSVFLWEYHKGACRQPAGRDEGKRQKVWWVVRIFGVGDYSQRSATEWVDAGGAAGGKIAGYQPCDHHGRQRQCQGISDGDARNLASKQLAGHIAEEDAEQNAGQDQAQASCKHTAQSTCALRTQSHTNPNLVNVS